MTMVPVKRLQIPAGTATMEGMTWAGLGLRGELLSEAGQPAVAVE